jgi:hypothetical protein
LLDVSMRVRPSIPFLLAAAMVSLLLVLPWIPDSRAPGYFRLELELRSSRPGMAQLYWDNGEGLAEARSNRQILPADQDTRLQFPLPPERLVALRLDPLDRAGELAIRSARIASREGRILRELPLDQFHPVQQIASLTVSDGILSVTTPPQANDPILTLGNFEPLDLSRAGRSTSAFLLRLSGLVFLTLVLLALVGRVLLDRRPSLRHRLSAAGLWLAERPRRSIALMAIVAMVASSYPVVFLGKSFVSPSLGAALLYAGVPTLPEMTSTAPAEVKDADVGAILWQHVPYSIVQHDALAGGELPLWNRYNSAGVAMLGQGQSSFGDPFHLLPVLARGAAWAWDVKFLLAKWLLACGVGLAVWNLTAHRPAALLAAASAPFIGFFVYRVNHPAIFSLCYAPWVLVAWQGALRASDGRRLIGWAAVWLVANLTLLCSGTAKEAFILLLGLNGAGLLLLLLDGGSGQRKLWQLAVLTGAGLVLLLLSAPHWLLFLDTLRQSYTVYDAPQAFQLPPGLAVALFDEIFHRPFQVGAAVINPSANLLALLGLAWLVVRWQSAWSDRAVRALGLAAVIPALFVFGIIPPSWIIAVPGLAGIMHIDNTFSCVLIVLAMVLAGWGWREAWQRLATPAGRGEAVVVILLLVGAIAVHYGTAQAILRSAFSAHSWGRHTQIDAWVHGYVLSMVLGSILGLFALHHSRQTGRWTGTTVLLAAVGFLSVHWRHGLHVGAGNANYVVIATERPHLLAPSPTIKALQTAAAETPARIAGLGSTLFPGWSGAYRLEGINGPDALSNPYYRELLLGAGVPQVWGWRYELDAVRLPALRPILDAVNTPFVVAPSGDAFSGGGGYELIASSDLHLYRSATAWPRAYFVDRISPYHDLHELVKWIQEADGQPIAGVAATEAPARATTGAPAGRVTAAARDYELTTNRTTFTIDAPRAGVAVLTEAFMRDAFRVTINGAPATYFRVNHAFKGVVLPAAGQYRITFQYRPPLLPLALGLSAAGLLLGLAGLSFARHPRLLPP